MTGWHTQVKVDSFNLGNVPVSYDYDPLYATLGT
jgi:hypothetical protein